MSLETECKKIAVNLQQLTDAVTTLTAVLEIHKPVVIPTPDDTVKKDPCPMGDAAGLQIKEADYSPSTNSPKVNEHGIETANWDKKMLANYVESTNSPKVNEPIVNTVVEMHAGIQDSKANDPIIANAHEPNDPIAKVVNGEAMTMQEANAELQGIVKAIGDGGDAIRVLLKQHNAISLGQIPMEKYGEFVGEARKLIPGQTA